MEYEQIRQEKIGQLKENMQKQLEERNRQKEAELKLEEILRLCLTTEAKARLYNIKLVNLDLYFKTAQFLAYLQQAGKIKNKITEEQLKELLKKLAEKKEITIKRK